MTLCWFQYPHNTRNVNLHLTLAHLNINEGPKNEQVDTEATPTSRQSIIIKPV
jgi:hypothetical protein